MKGSLRYVDGFMLVVFLLWLSSTDFEAITPMSWLAGGAVLAYLLVTGWLRYRKTKTEAASKPERGSKKNKDK